MEILSSNIDQSVNFIFPKNSSFIEARYVRRNDAYFIAYLSSQNGCKQRCRFCHLTATGQLTDNMCDLNDFEKQLDAVLLHHSQQIIQPKLVHINFMARGEPLLNPVVKEFNELFCMIENKCQEYGLQFKIKISTIMPTLLPESILNNESVDLYYSLYSLDRDFRKKWIPNGLDPEEVGKHLKSLKGKLILHQTFIQGQNDRKEDIKLILDWLSRYGLEANFNIVRYNSYSEKFGVETNEANLNELNHFISSHSQIKSSKLVSRVGLDVKASCGMFIK